jgi:protein ImuB
MAKRFVSIWFRYLITDWHVIRQPLLRQTAFVISVPSHGRMVVAAANDLVQSKGIYIGTTVADARALVPSLEVIDEVPGVADKLLRKLAEWCIRFTPFVSVDAPDGLILDATGCTHLWGGDEQYIAEIKKRLQLRGYDVRVAIADTIGAAWAVARFGKNAFVVATGQQAEALLSLPPAALRLETGTVEKLSKLGLRQIAGFINMPRHALRRRFGNSLLQRLHQAIGQEDEMIQPIITIEPYQERLQCLEPIVTATGIEIALRRLLETLCQRLQQEEKGLRAACFKSYRVDGKTAQVEIGTNHPSHNVEHLFKLFEISIPTIEPDLGIELFVLEAKKVETAGPVQERFWETACGLDNIKIAELLDRFAGKFGTGHIHRYLPDEHYWPERSVKLASSLKEQPATAWRIEKPRPLQLLPLPEPILVSAPIPDYPPMNFRYKGKLHTVVKSDGPERIEQEWWLQEGQHRDYYSVEDEEGNRYWLFRLGHYSMDKSHRWFIHGFFT